uniref:Uncharacterized protein n=1 Tax=Arundo donax TaxID=35708 RepID=A0A0A9A247_ARUDO
MYSIAGFSICAARLGLPDVGLNLSKSSIDLNVVLIQFCSCAAYMLYMLCKSRISIFCTENEKLFVKQLCWL